MTRIRATVLTLVMLGLAWNMAGVSPAASGEPFNLATPTLGGSQVWADEYARQGWRIQQNILTGHWRLLDADDVRRAWGGYDHCRATLDRLRPRVPAAGHTVMLLHGIAPRPWTFVKLRRALADAGYNVVVFSYPSTRRAIPAHAEQLERLLDRFEDSETISFVSHSMGGLVLRELLARDGAWRDRIEVGRMVMIAPPNRGSAIARLIRQVTLYKWIYGPAGQELTPEAAESMPGLDGEFAIIAGGDHDDGYNPLLAGDDDGTVAVAETRLEGALDFLVVDSLHSPLSNDPRTVDAVLGFLENGRFKSPDRAAAKGVTE